MHDWYIRRTTATIHCGNTEPSITKHVSKSGRHRGWRSLTSLMKRYSPYQFMNCYFGNMIGVIFFSLLDISQYWLYTLLKHLKASFNYLYSILGWQKLVLCTVSAYIHTSLPTPCPICRLIVIPFNIQIGLHSWLTELQLVMWKRTCGTHKQQCSRVIVMHCVLTSSVEK